MGQKLRVFPLGNAQTMLLELDNKKLILFDYAQVKSEDSQDKRYNLAEAFEDIRHLDAVVFSHAHEDHIKGSADFFYLEHAAKYQDESRVKIDEMWISSAFLMDTDCSCEDARVIRQEARYRIKQGNGIKIFAQGSSLDKWLEDSDVDIADVQHLIFHAGKIISHDLGEEIQVFLHAPFSEDCDDVSDKNDPSVVMQVRLYNGTQETNILFTGDSPSTTLDKVVELSVQNGNEEYLAWDIYDVPHHCSYTGLTQDKNDCTNGTLNPTENVKWLLKQAAPNAHMVASCEAIPHDSTPPCVEAKRAYIKFADTDVDFSVTMEFPNKKAPNVMEFEIDYLGLTKINKASHSSYFRTPSPRAGK